MPTPVVIPYKIPIIPKPNDLIIMLNGQDSNVCVGDPDGNNEYTAGRWMLENKILPLTEGRNFNVSYIFTPLEKADKIPYSVGIPLTLRACFAYAKARPERQFHIVHWHTDSKLSGDDPVDGHYGFMARDAKGQAVGKIWEKHFKPVYNDTAKYLDARFYPEYYALGWTADKEIPANVTLLIAETGVHGDAAAWKWYRNHVDAIAKAAVDAAEEALKPTTVPPIDNQWTKRIAELTARVTALEQDKENLQAEIDEDMGIIRNAIGMVDKLKGELTKAL